MRPIESVESNSFQHNVAAIRVILRIVGAFALAIVAFLAVNLMYLSITHAYSESSIDAKIETDLIARSNDVSTTLSNLQYYDRIQAYLNRRLERVNRERDSYYQDTDISLTDFLAMSEVHRGYLREMLAVPSECLSQQPPTLQDERYVTTYQGIEIYSLELSVCQGELTLWGLMGQPVERTERLPLVITFHGTSGTPEGLFGIDPRSAYNNDYHHSFALRLAQAGYVVFAPLLITGFGNDYNKTRNELHNRSISIGDSLVGVELGEMINGLDLLVQLESVDPARIMTYGISMGGLMSFYLGALDTRIQTIVVSQYIEDRVGKLTGLTYPDAYWRFEFVDYIMTPSLLKRFTDVAIAALIVPRRLFIETGQYDTRAIPAQQVFSQVQTIYQLLGLPADSVGSVVGPGGHEIFLTDALQFMNEEASTPPDLESPTGALKIVGEVKYTQIPTITLWLTATDNSGIVNEMQLGFEESMSSGVWQSYTMNIDWVLEPVQGQQYVFCQFRDVAGNVSAIYSDTIILDSVGPNGVVVINGDAEVTREVTTTLALTATDATTHVSEMRIAHVPNFEGALWQPYVSETAWLLKDNNGEKVIYAQFRDIAGNVSAIYSDTIILDSVGPDGAVVINDDARVTQQVTATLTMSATDVTTSVSEMRISYAPYFEDALWQPYVSETAWLLKNDNGEKAIFAQFRDLAGNVSVIYSDTITLNTNWYLYVPLVVR